MNPDDVKQRIAADLPDCEVSVTGDGSHFEAIVVDTVADIAKLIEPDTDAIGIDEAQFFGWEITELCEKMQIASRHVKIPVGQDPGDFDENTVKNLREYLYE